MYRFESRLTECCRVSCRYDDDDDDDRSCGVRRKRRCRNRIRRLRYFRSTSRRNCRFEIRWPPRLPRYRRWSNRATVSIFESTGIRCCSNCSISFDDPAKTIHRPSDDRYPNSNRATPSSTRRMNFCRRISTKRNRVLRSLRLPSRIAADPRSTPNRRSRSVIYCNRRKRYRDPSYTTSRHPISSTNNSATIRNFHLEIANVASVRLLLLFVV